MIGAKGAHANSRKRKNSGGAHRTMHGLTQRGNIGARAKPARIFDPQMGHDSPPAIPFV
jgi:hypothetical protein